MRFRRVTDRKTASLENVSTERLNEWRTSTFIYDANSNALVNRSFSKWALHRLYFLLTFESQLRFPDTDSPLKNVQLRFPVSSFATLQHFFNSVFLSFMIFTNLIFFLSHELFFFFSCMRWLIPFVFLFKFPFLYHSFQSSILFLIFLPAFLPSYIFVIIRFSLLFHSFFDSICSHFLYILFIPSFSLSLFLCFFLFYYLYISFFANCGLHFDNTNLRECNFFVTLFLFFSCFNIHLL